MNTKKTNEKIRASAEWKPFIRLVANGRAYSVIEKANTRCSPSMSAAVDGAFEVAWAVFRNHWILPIVLARYNELVFDFKPKDFDTGINV